MTGSISKLGLASLFAVAVVAGLSAPAVAEDELWEHQQRVQAQQDEERRMNEIATEMNQAIESDDGPGVEYAPNSFVSFPPEAWEDFVRHAQETHQQDLEAKFANDPTYQSLKKGVWTYRNSDRNGPFKTCEATFWTRNGGVSFIHMGGAEDYTFLGFFGGSIPSVKHPRFVTMDLIQSGETQRVRALNLHFGSVRSMGMVLFNVHSPAILIGAIEDRQDFALRLKGETIAEGEWHSGLKARKKLAACLKSQGFAVR